MLAVVLPNNRVSPLTYNFLVVSGVDDPILTVPVFVILIFSDGALLVDVDVPKTNCPYGYAPLVRGPWIAPIHADENCDDVPVLVAKFICEALLAVVSELEIVNEFVL